MGVINLSDHQPHLVVQDGDTAHILPLAFIRDLAHNGEGLQRALAIALLERLEHDNDCV